VSFINVLKDLFFKFNPVDSKVTDILGDEVSNNHFIYSNKTNKKNLKTLWVDKGSYRIR
jgi:hypothetical protein